MKCSNKMYVFITDYKFLKVCILASQYGKCRLKSQLQASTPTADIKVSGKYNALLLAIFMDTFHLDVTLQFHFAYLLL